MEIRRIGYRVYKVPRIFSKADQYTVNMILSNRQQGKKGIKAAMYEISEIVKDELCIVPKRVTLPSKALN